MPCALHSHVETAKKLLCPRLHCPLPVWERAGKDWKPKLLGISVHSLEEAVLAERLGAGYLTAGHIFATDCKKGLPPRGLSFLREIASAVRIPVYGIGGMDRSKEKEVEETGAAGICIMSGYMRL